MNKEKFIETISIDEEGHYPFSMYVEEKAGEATFCALALNDVHLVYAAVIKYSAKQFEKVYFTLDFPAMGEIATDFVAAYFLEKNGGWESVIIPYDEQGNRLDEITKGQTFDKLLNQCRNNCWIFKLEEK